MRGSNGSAPSPCRGPNARATVLAGHVRQGTTPAVSALAVTIIGLTIAVSLAYEAVRQRREAAHRGA